MTLAQLATGDLGGEKVSLERRLMFDDQEVEGDSRFVIVVSFRGYPNL